MKSDPGPKAAVSGVELARFAHPLRVKYTRSQPKTWEEITVLANEKFSSRLKRPLLRQHIQRAYARHALELTKQGDTRRLLRRLNIADAKRRRKFDNTIEPDWKKRRDESLRLAKVREQKAESKFRIAQEKSQGSYRKRFVKKSLKKHR